MRGAGILRTKFNQWGHGLSSLCALLAIALHVFAIEGHVHVAAFPQHGAAASASAHEHSASGGAAGQFLSNSSNPAPCLFCQVMASAGAGLILAAPLLVLFGAAALVAALFGQRQVSLQRLNAWRSRAPPRIA
jgi:hypothetical protein